MSNLYGTGPNQVPLNSMLGNLAFQDKAYVSVDKVGIGSTFVDSGTSGQILQVYGGGAYVSGSVGIGTTNPTQPLDVLGNIRVRSGLYDVYNQVGVAGSILISTGAGVSWTTPFAAGIQGIQGNQGLQGLQGVQGVQGISGTSQGTQGTQGTQGVQGVQGRQGTQGTQGPAGPIGSTFTINNLAVLLSSDETESSGTSDTSSVKSYSVPVNTYSYIIVESEVGIVATTAISEWSFSLVYGGVTKETIPLKIADTGTGDEFKLRATVKYAEAFTAGGTVQLNVAAVGSAAGTWNVHSFRVYGIGSYTFGAGAQGNQGVQGLQGLQGLQGNQGNQGVQGFQGNQGIQGVQGNQGNQGNQGVQGFQGNQGIQGVQGLQGNQGVQGFQGNQGIQGVQGLQGNQGTQGLQGNQGNQGVQGLQGNQGNQGVQGLQGNQGTQGVQGLQGNQGTQGVQGLQGNQGTQGVQGLQGNQGTQGVQGLQGNQGNQGVQGVQGRQGLQGLQGVQGVQSSQGIQGASGGGGGSGSLSVNDDTTSINPIYVALSTATSGPIGFLTVSSTNLSFIPSSGTLTGVAATFTANPTSTLSALNLTGSPSASNINRGVVSVGQTVGFSDQGILGNFVADTTGYVQVVVQNKSSATNASADVIVNNDRVAGASNYGDFGINSSAFTGASAFSTPNGTYLYSSGGTLTIGTLNSYNLEFATNDIVSFYIDYLTSVPYFGSVISSISLTNPIAVFTDNVNNYSQIQIQNQSTAATASIDFVASTDTATDISEYIDMGINNSGFVANGLWNAKDAYLYVQSPTVGNGGNLILGTSGLAGRSIIFHTAGTAVANERMRITDTSVDVADNVEVVSGSIYGKTLAASYGMFMP